MRPKSEIYTPKRDDEHPHPFHMRSPPPGRKTCYAKDVFMLRFIYLAFILQYTRYSGYVICTSFGVCSVNFQAAKTKQKLRISQNLTKFHSVYDFWRKTAMAALKTIVGLIGIVLIVSNLRVRQLF